MSIGGPGSEVLLARGYSAVCGPRLSILVS